MAGVKISSLPDAGELLPEDRIPIARGSSNASYLGGQLINQFSNLTTRVNIISAITQTSTVRSVNTIQPANTFFGGPIAGNPQLPGFRLLNGTDIPNLSASKITAGILNVDRIPNISASKITSEVFNPDRIPFLHTDKINDGVFSNARIPNLDADKITTGTFLVQRIPTLPSNKIQGIFQANQIPNLDASKITTGVFSSERIPFIPAGEITGILPINKGGTGASQVANNLVFAGPSGLTQALEPPSFRFLVPGDIPNLNANKITEGIISTTNLPTTVVYTTSNQTIGGTKIFSSTIGGSINGNAETVTNGVYTVGNQTIGGVKVFNNQVVFNSTVQTKSLGVGTFAPTIDGQINAAGDVIAFFSSDERLKENIKPIENALEKVSKISGVTFDWTKSYLEQNGGADGYFVRKNDVGVIAQEVKEILPEVVAQRQDGMLAVKYEKLVPLLLEAIKELSTEVKELKQKLNS